jgi:Skp family chaperone for outer membrane proteins
VRRLLVLLALAGLAAAPPLPAQDRPASGFLFINQDRILTDSRTGQTLLEEEEAARDRLRAEARAIDSAFEAEERRLTEQRATLPPDEFRAFADEFDARVIAARREQDERSEAVAQEFDQRRRAFYASVAPILVELMERHRAQAIFDETSVLLADQSLNVTDEAIAIIDARFGGSPPAAPEPPADAPAPEDAAPAPPEEGN